MIDDDRAKLPWWLAVVSSVLVVVCCCCYSPSSPSQQQPQPAVSVHFHHQLVYSASSSSSSKVVWAEPLAGRGNRYAVATEDARLHVVEAAADSSSSSYTPLSSTKLGGGGAWGAKPVAMASSSSSLSYLCVMLASGRVQGYAQEAAGLRLVWERVVWVMDAEEDSGNGVYSAASSGGFYLVHGGAADRRRRRRRITKVDAAEGAVEWEAALEGEVISVREEGEVVRVRMAAAGEEVHLDSSTGSTLASTDGVRLSVEDSDCVTVHKGRRRVTSSCSASGAGRRSTASSGEVVEVDGVIIAALVQEEAALLAVHARNASVLWRHNLTSPLGQMRVEYVLGEPFVVVDGITALRVRDGYLAASTPMQMRRIGGSQTMQTGEGEEVHHVTLRAKRAVSSYYHAPLSLIPALLSLAVLWAAVGWTALDPP